MSRVAKVDDAQNVSMTKAVRSPNFMPPRGKFASFRKSPFCVSVCNNKINNITFSSHQARINASFCVLVAICVCGVVGGTYFCAFLVRKVMCMHIT